MQKKKIIALLLLLVLVITTTGCTTLNRTARITSGVLSAATLSFNTPTIYNDLYEAWSAFDGALAVAEVLTDSPAPAIAVKPKPDDSVKPSVPSVLSEADKRAAEEEKYIFENEL